MSKRSRFFTLRSSLGYIWALSCWWDIAGGGLCELVLRTVIFNHSINLIPTCSPAMLCMLREHVVIELLLPLLLVERTGRAGGAGSGDFYESCGCSLSVLYGWMGFGAGHFSFLLDESSHTPAFPSHRGRE